MTARVQPEAVPASDPLASIDGVTNAVIVEASPVGQITIVGPGAGPQLADQGVLSDIIAVARQKGTAADQPTRWPRLRQGAARPSRPASEPRAAGTPIGPARIIQRKNNVQHHGQVTAGRVGLDWPVLLRVSIHVG